jgi:hypothetical protein
LVAALLAMRRLRLWKRHGKHSGEFLVRASMVLSLITTGGYCVAIERSKQDGWSLERARVLQELEGKEGRHLVLVRYDKKHSDHEEWVNNDADLENAKVIWAREMYPLDKNRELLDYYRDRQIWLLEADAEKPGPVLYGN